MSTELVFKRPGRVEIKVSKCAAGRVYVTVWQATRKSWQQLATVNCVNPARCSLLAYENSWVLEAGDHARFHLTPKEGEQVSEKLEIQVEKHL